VLPASLKINPSTPASSTTWPPFMMHLSNSAPRAHLRRAIKIDPQSGCEKNLGTNLLAQHKYKKGWEAYKVALAIDPNIFQENSGPRSTIQALLRIAAHDYYLARAASAGMKDQAIEYCEWR